MIVTKTWVFFSIKLALQTKADLTTPHLDYHSVRENVCLCVHVMPYMAKHWVAPGLPGSTSCARDRLR